MPVEQHYFDERHDISREDEQEVVVWPEEGLELLARHFADSDDCQGWYTDYDVANVKRHLKQVVPGGVQGKNVLVIGTKVLID